MVTEAGDRRSWLVLAGLTALAAFQPLGCEQKGKGDSALGASLSALLESAGPNVIVPALADAEAKALALDEALARLEATLTAGDDPAADQLAAQEAWRAVMSSWQRVELMQLGPLGSSLTALGGEDLRDEVYSWPSVNPCRVDQVTADGSYAKDTFFTESLVNTTGLDALEHLLFAAAENVCPAQVTPNADGAWEALGPDEVARRRVDYARVLTAGVLTALDDAQARFVDDGFSKALALDDPNTPYESEQQALNAVYDALFYLELSTKDKKLATPLGLRDCGETICPDDLEHLPSGFGGPAIAANLAGFRALYTGQDGPGVDDLLVELGHGEVNDAVIAGLNDADAAVAALGDTPLAELLVNEPEKVLAAHDAVKVVTDLLKGDVATLLALQIPAEAAGDND
ncbi:MAG: imelysin family protein [Deltaproteobacteria bacterium]|nr:imelysin family protein [Deltaproteobacteria bacterium]